MSRVEREDVEPWYKQFWPWFIFGLPGIVVIASMVTIYIAVISNDGLVVDDYYKEGLAYNKTVERDLLANKIGLRGELLLNPDRSLVELRLIQQQQPEKMTLRFIYATQASNDQAIELSHINGSTYRGTYERLKVGKWHIQVEPESSEWRLLGQINYPEQLSVLIKPGSD